MKGISPLIALIMLIALTMIIAGVLATWTTRWATEKRTEIEFCSEAKAYIRGGAYDPATNTLHLIVYNNGKVDLTFKVFLTYKNSTTETYSEDFSIPAGSVKTFTIDNVASNLKEATVQSNECPGAQDLLQYMYIKGMGS